MTALLAAPGDTVPAVGDAVALEGVHKAFGASPALVELDLRVPASTVTVLVGPNGAGKTTAIRVITGALLPERGRVRVFGLDPGAHGERVRARCGVVSAKPALYDRLSGWDNLRYSAALHKLGRGPALDTRIAETAARFGIDAALERPVGAYSTGMKTRLALARSVLHRPALVLYDEPTSGLDPESSRAVLDLIREMPGEGTTVVMCTHLLAEADGLADQLVVLQDGAAVVSGRPGDLARELWPNAALEVAVQRPELLGVLGAVAGVMSWDCADGRAVVQLDAIDRVPEVVSALATAGAGVTRVAPREPSLEDLYFAVRARPGASRLGRVEGGPV